MDPAKMAQAAENAASSGGGDSLIVLFTVFALAVFVGYYVVWNVTSALHSPLNEQFRSVHVGVAVATPTRTRSTATTRRVIQHTGVLQ